MTSNQFTISSPPTDAISALKFSPASDSTRFVVSSWDKNVYVYDLRDENGNTGEGKLLQKFEHRAPVLDVCFGATEDEIYTAGLDWDVKRIDLVTSTQNVLSSHDAGVRSVVYSKEHNMVISASWDTTLHVHRMSEDRSTVAASTIIPLPSKPFSMSLTATKLVVAMASRTLHIYDLKALSTLTGESEGPNPSKVEVEPWQRRESSLKFMTRSVACMPDDAGYASSSIEGRVAVEWFDPSAESQARKYAFKCHRQASEDVDVVYPVNALAFHPIHGTFASGGGDGVVALWDGIAKRRIRQYQKYPSSVAAVAFSSNGKYLAIAISPGYESGQDDFVDGTVRIYVRELGETEAKGKGAK
ncbi:WD40 repeat domain-containing protein [Aspergillus lucknowensis]|uniref:WD40-repeat-containing domain protein n=1 Tax=Aspergillus lucknowensis TaxID=176173 RepID=A0ABR4M1Q9_9EURO